jgi:hypothetical protein
MYASSRDDTDVEGTGQITLRKLDGYTHPAR